MTAFLDRFFHISARGSDVCTELAAGLTTFLTMAYIIVAQPAVMSRQMLGVETGIDFGAVMTATCLAAALATLQSRATTTARRLEAIRRTTGDALR